MNRIVSKLALQSRIRVRSNSGYDLRALGCPAIVRDMFMHCFRVLRALLVFLASICVPTQATITTYIGSQSSHLSTTRLHDYIEHIVRAQQGEWSTYTVSAGASRSSRPNSTNQFLFGTACVGKDTTFMVSGSRAPGRVPSLQQWRADDYGLPTDFVSAIFMQPTIQNSFISFTGYIDLKHVVPRLYLQIEVPCVFSHWNMHMAEKIINPGVNGYDPGLINKQGVSRQNLLGSFASYITGAATPLVEGVAVDPLRYAKIDQCGGSKRSISEIYAVLGYDLYAADTGAITVTGRMAIPAGTRPQGEYLFEPVVGNGRHWQLGAGLCGYWRHYIHHHENESFLFYGECFVDHLFSSKQGRTFDLKDRPLSRYLPAVRFSRQGRGSLMQEISPVANFTHLEVKVSIPYQAQLILMCVYEKKGWCWMIGYNLFAQSAESIKQCGCSLLDTHKWALKADPAVVLTTDDIDFDSARSKKMSQVLFAQTYYTGRQRRYITPYIGFGGSVELGEVRPPIRYKVSCSPINSALSMWGVWVNLGFSCH